jgi:prepilin-type N-terminal cleavage/methylation domain-containing protein
MQAKTEHGFTLTELIIVITIIAILATFAFPAFTTVQERAEVTKDMNNLRQLAFATQRCVNDHDGSLFPGSLGPWMNQLCTTGRSNSAYVSDWGVFESPFDTRTRSNSAFTTPVSYGLNHNVIVYGDPSAGLDTSKIINPTAFILFAPAQALSTSVSTISFQGTAASSAGGVTVVGLGNPPNQAQSSPGGTVSVGIQQRRQRICAVCFDGHAENMLWTVFCTLKSTTTDPNGDCRWYPFCNPP